MVNAEKVRTYSELPSPLLTAYLDTNPAKVANRTPAPEYLTWLSTEAKAVAATLPLPQQRLFREQCERVENYLRGGAAQTRGVLVFSGAGTWEVVPLPQEVENELHWGAASVTQLLWLLDEHKPYGVVIVDRTMARFFRYRLEELVPLAEKSLEVDISDWSKKDMGKFAHPRESGRRGAGGIKKTRGSQRDTFEHRLGASYARLCSEVARQAAHLAEAENLGAVFLVGSNRLLGSIAGGFPPEFRRPVIKIAKDFGGLAAAELGQRLAPVVAQWERAHESELVDTLLSDGRGTILGLDEILVHLQEGKIRTLLLARDLDTSLRRCASCGWTDRSADVRCAHCGGQRQRVTLREAMPELAWKHGVEVQIVSGEAAERLKGAEGMGGWLRAPIEAHQTGALKRAG
ncbi:MAG TPA: hypothetical protein VGS20_02460 [Candidatus Acidoferrales bacterium]|nr:hypothetical protein [Candidatus Acidoferrales bacterium]